MYSISGHGSMIADRVRMQAYTDALARAVKPGMVVLDIGTGTGIFSLLACRLGARRVYAIEPDNVVGMAREMAATNGCADKIEFFQDLSTNVKIDERADLIVSDIRGVLPLFQSHIPSIVDARTRLLKPDGLLIPQRDSLWAAVVEADDYYRERISFWEDTGFDFDLRAARGYVANSWTRVMLKAEQLLVEPGSWAEIDYSSVESENVGGEVSWTIEREGRAHGVAVWFDSTLVEDISFSNAPGRAALIYGQAFFPLLAPVALSAGDQIYVKLRADLVGEDYIWRWDTVARDASGHEKARFRQSNFFSSPLAPAALKKRASNYLPDLNEEGRIDSFIVSMMNGENRLGDIARRVAERFPHRFRSWPEALNRVSDLSTKYS